MSSNSCTETSGRYGQSSRNQEDMALQPAQSQQTAARPSSAPTASGSALPAASSRAPAASVPQSPIRRNQWRPRRASRPSNQPQTAGSSSSPAQSSSATASTVPAGSSSHQPARSFSFVEAEDVLERPGITPPPTFPIRREAGLTRNVAPQGREESLREALSREPGERTARGPVSSSSKPQCQGMSTIVFPILDKRLMLDRGRMGVLDPS